MQIWGCANFENWSQQVRIETGWTSPQGERFVCFCGWVEGWMGRSPLPMGCVSRKPWVREECWIVGDKWARTRSRQHEGSIKIRPVGDNRIKHSSAQRNRSCGWNEIKPKATGNASENKRPYCRWPEIDCHAWARRKNVIHSYKEIKSEKQKGLVDTTKENGVRARRKTGRLTAWGKVRQRQKRIKHWRGRIVSGKKQIEQNSIIVLVNTVT
jgi:hypothetical protein